MEELMRASSTPYTDIGKKKINFNPLGFIKYNLGNYQLMLFKRATISRT